MTNLRPNLPNPPPLPVARNSRKSLWRQPTRWLDVFFRRLSQTATDESHGAVEMSCPQCGRPMVLGSVALEYSWWGSGLFKRWPYLTPHFRARYRRQSILEVSEARAAFRCDACGTTLLLGRELREAPCLHCDGMIPPGGTRCPQCGWGYDPPPNSLHR